MRSNAYETSPIRVGGHPNLAEPAIENLSSVLAGFSTATLTAACTRSMSCAAKENFVTSFSQTAMAAANTKLKRVICLVLTFGTLSRFQFCL